MNPANALLTVAVLALDFSTDSAKAQAVTRMLSGHPPGGAVDTLARIFADKLGFDAQKPAGEQREGFARTRTTVLNAGVGPILSRYLLDLPAYRVFGTPTDRPA